VSFVVATTFKNDSHKRAEVICPKHGHLAFTRCCSLSVDINRLTPDDPYMGRIAPLTSKRCILYIYSRNVGTAYFKHALYCPFFSFKMQFVS